MEWQNHLDEGVDPKFGGKVAVHRSPLRFWGSELPPSKVQRSDINADRAAVGADWLENRPRGGKAARRDATSLLVQLHAFTCAPVASCTNVRLSTCGTGCGELGPPLYFP